jgi:hypothetical protein
MSAEGTRHGTGSYEVKAWEFNLLLIEVIVFSGLVAGGVMVMGRRLLGPGGLWLEAAWMGLGFFLLGLALYPVMSIQSRHARGRELRFGRWLAGVLGGTVVGVLIYALIG